MQLHRATSSDDTASIAHLIWETDPEMCAFVFGDWKTWHHYCAIEWRAQTGLHTSSSAVVAKICDDVVGVLIAYPASEMPERYTATVSRYEASVGRRMTEVGWLFPTLPEQALYIFNLAVLSAHRGRGIGRLLLTEAESLAREFALTSIHLDVPVTSAAVKFYERLGYRRLTKTDLLEPETQIPAHYRMQKLLA